MSFVPLIRFQNKVALISAGTRGIGLAIATRLAREGATVIVSSPKQKSVDEALESLKRINANAMGVVCNTNVKEDRLRMIQEVVGKFGLIDVLVSNHSSNPYVGAFLDIPDDKFTKILDSNIKAHFDLAREVLPYMPKKQGSNMLFTSSVAAFRPIVGIETYSIAKLGMLGLVNNLAGHLAEDNIRVNSLVCGVIDTKFSQVLRNDDAWSVNVERFTSMRRMGTSDEVAGAAAFLCSDDASYVSGENMVINGAPIRL